MPTATYIALANATASGSQSTITFSSIPATYRDLVLVVEGSVPSASDIYVQFNGSGSGYSFVQMAGNGSSASSSAGSLSYAQISNQGSGRVMAIAHFMDYSATDKHKTFLSRNTNNPVRAWACRWANTNAINQIAVTNSGGNFDSGFTMSLYGIVS